MSKDMVLTFVLICLIAFFDGCGKVKLPSEQEMLAEIEKLHQKDVESIRSRDIKTLITLWTDDGVLLGPGISPIVGRDAIREYMQKQKQEVRNVEIIEYNQDFKEIKIIGNWAFEWALFTGEYRLFSGGDTIHEKAKLFRVLKRQKDGTWKVARSIWHNDPVQED